MRAVPQLELFGHRWHLAADAVPLLVFPLAALHGCWVILFLVGATTFAISGQDESCNDAPQLWAAQFGLLGLFFLAFATESAIASLGLRGGPLEIQKRRAIPMLLYLKLGIWAVTVGWTVFATWVVSGDVSDTCFVHKNCGDNLKGCVHLDAPGSAPLPSDCQYVIDNQEQFFLCQKRWGDLSSSWYYEGNCSGNQTLSFWLDRAQADRLRFSAGVQADVSHWLRLNRPFLAHTTALLALLDSQGASYDPADPLLTVPWFGCLSEACQAVISAASSCMQWDSMVVYDGSSPKKDLFVGIVFSSWAAITFTGIVVVLTINTTPDYTQLDSWEAMVKRTSRCLCCWGTLEAADAAYGTKKIGEPASKEIAKSLYLLFGGVDLDPTDRLLGLALVSKEQHRRRREHAVHALQQAGVLGARRPGFFQGVVSTVATQFRRTLIPDANASFQPESAARAAAQLEAVAEAEEGLEDKWEKEEEPAVALHPAGAVLAAVGTLESVGEEGMERPANAASAAADSAEQGMPTVSLQPHAANTSSHSQAPGNLPPTPLDVEGDGGSSAASAAAQGSGPEGASSIMALPSTQMLYRRSQLRLVSQLLLDPHAGQASPAQPAGASPSDGIPGSPACTLRSPHQEAEPSAGAEAHTEKARPNSGEQVEIRVVQQYTPLLTPVPLPYEVEATPQEAATICTGHHDAVPRAVVEEAQHMSRFAMASYGLQSSFWDKGKRTPMCYGNMTTLLQLMGKPVKIESIFRVHNYKAIVAATGVDPSDLLYVSYANAPGGVLPYMIMLHRPTKSVVVSVRGTVSTEDLVTDLLTTPVDIGAWLPAWVQQANTSGERMYAHAGVYMSTDAILKDMEDHGLLQELLECQLSRAASSSGVEVQPGRGVALQKIETSRSSPEFVAPIRGDNRNEEVHLPVQRAQTMIRERLCVQGWQVIVTGHSLGAAVACLLSFHLKDMFPDLKCWAFSPPGGTVSWNLSRIAQSFCTSVIVGKDIISRLSFSTARRVVDEMVTNLARCKRPKLVVLWDLLVSRRGQDLPPGTFCHYDEISDESVKTLEGYYRSSKLHGGEQVEMYPPGRLMFFRPFKRVWPKRPMWDAVWIDAPTLLAEGIIVSPSVLHHHMAYTVEEALNSALAGEVNQAQRTQQQASIKSMLAVAGGDAGDAV